jgi:hypothetical protein
MKKSKALYLAQIAVLRDEELTFDESLEILKFLMDAEDSAKYSEKLKEEREKANEAVC